MSLEIEIERRFCENSTLTHSGNVGPDLGLGRINGEKGGDTKPIEKIFDVHKSNVAS